MPPKIEEIDAADDVDDLDDMPELEEDGAAATGASSGVGPLSQENIENVARRCEQLNVFLKSYDTR
jgi:hypothetical protein